MTEDTFLECGVAAAYWLDNPVGDTLLHGRQEVTENVAPMIPGMLMDVRRLGQLSATGKNRDDDR